MADAFKIRDEAHMVEVVKSLTDYMKTYPDQSGYESYTAGIFINDILYGLGISLNKDKYEYANGFNEFRFDLIKLLEEDYSFKVFKKSKELNEAPVENTSDKVD